MKRKNILLGIVSLLTLTIVLPAEAKPDMYLEMQCEITEMRWTSPYTFEAYIEGVASGPDIRTGRVTGVDYGYFDENGLHLNVYYTVTDKDGDSISVHVTGDSIITNPGRIVFFSSTTTSPNLLVGIPPIA